METNREISQQQFLRLKCIVFIKRGMTLSTMSHWKSFVLCFFLLFRFFLRRKHKFWSQLKDYFSFSSPFRACGTTRSCIANLVWQKNRMLQTDRPQLKFCDFDKHSQNSLKTEGGVTLSRFPTAVHTQSLPNLFWAAGKDVRRLLSAVKPSLKRSMCKKKLAGVCWRSCRSSSGSPNNTQSHHCKKFSSS